MRDFTHVLVEIGFFEAAGLGNGVGVSEHRDSEDGMETRRKREAELTQRIILQQVTHGWDLLHRLLFTLILRFQFDPDTQSSSRSV